MEGNRDGTDDYRSWNCGTEGPTTDPAITQLRRRQQRNLLATLLLSQGVPSTYEPMDFVLPDALTVGGGIRWSPPVPP